MYEKLSRDYIQQPLVKIHGKKLELPLKDDVELLYNYYNLSKKELKDYFKVSSGTIGNILAIYEIKKDSNNRVEKIKQTKLQKYGDETYNNRNKMKQTSVQKYGVSSFSKTNEYKEKTKRTNIQKYGCEWVLQNNDIRNKGLETKLQKYGDKNYVNIEKRRQTNIQKYDLEYANQTSINYEKYKIFNNKEELKQYIEKYNIKSALQLANILQVSPSVTAKYIKCYNLLYLMDYSQSIAEKEIREYVNQYYETENNTKKYLNGKEIDIYIPQLKIGIEFNGNYYHNEYIRTLHYHQQKSLIAEEKGIFIYHIFEYEWNTKKERIINQLNNLLKVNSQHIGARCCKIKEVSNKEKSLFLETNHLQGNDSSSIKLGLYYNDELVSIMTFCKPRFNKNYEWELSRFCCKANCNVIGGASKLFKYFIDTYKPKSVISYSNIAHTRGNLYNMLGFTLHEITPPNYVWCNGHEILSRYQCQKHKLLEQGYKGDSEADIMHNRGYYRIYDCGNKVWIYYSNK